MTTGIEDLGGIRWQLVLCLLAAWLIIFFCLFKGVKSSGKVVYVTATVPYIILTILLVRGLLLPGAMDGIRFYVTPDFKRLLEFKVIKRASVSAGVFVRCCFPRASINVTFIQSALSSLFDMGHLSLEICLWLLNFNYNIKIRRCLKFAKSNSGTLFQHVQTDYNAMCTVSLPCSFYAQLCAYNSNIGRSRVSCVDLFRCYLFNFFLYGKMVSHTLSVGGLYQARKAS